MLEKLFLDFIQILNQNHFYIRELIIKFLYLDNLLRVNSEIGYFIQYRPNLLLNIIITNFFSNVLYRFQNIQRLNFP